ncbi:MAG TPA: tetratricopeptide repeat protein [Acidobacteriota bacterium]|nr:tetratricopeptide repeat protein [Acidobacteriota bacterium]
MSRTWGAICAAAVFALVGLGPVATTSGGQAQRGDPELAAARRAVVDGRVEEALELLGGLATERPESGEVALWMGHALRRSGDPRGAAQQYLRAVRLDPTNAGALIALGDLQSDAGDLDSALDYYKRAITVAPDFPVGYRKAAGVEVQLVLHRNAIEHLRQYLELRPGDVVAMSVLGMEQYLDEDIDGAIATMERVVALEPDHVRGHFGLGMALADRPEEYTRALMHLEATTAADPGNAMALYLIGRIRASRGELEPAREALRSSLEIDSEQPDAHYRIALVYARLGERDAARVHQERFQELSQARDNEEELQRRIGLLRGAVDVAIAAQDLAGVRAVTEELAQLAPDDLNVLIVQARMALGGDEPDTGLQAASRALELYPDDWEALYLRGVLLHRTGQPADAVGFLERAVELNPMYGPGYAALGNALMAIGQPAEALNAYQSAVTVQPTTPAHYLNLASVYRALGQSDLESRALATHRRLLAEQ